MNDDRFHDLLADYLAGELGPERLAEFRAELDASNERRRLAEELQAAAAALESNLIPEDQAEQAVESLTWQDALRRAQSADSPSPLDSDAPLRLTPATQPARNATPPRAAFAPILRYAAAIILAFIGGYLLRGQNLPAPQTPPAYVSAPVQEHPTLIESPSSLNHGFAQKYAQAAREFPQSSAFTRSLLMVARK